jgi:NAD(P)-dependent dehydrogenase (short-subunit alcohol dehydrogenase family)
MSRRARRIQPKVALVTGAANGIGKAITRRLLALEWRVVIVDVDQRGLYRLNAQAPQRIAPVVANVAEEHAAPLAVDTALDRFGRLDAVVSNAGIMHRVPLRKHELVDWLRVFNTNLTAAYLLARAAERSLRRHKGSLVSIASTRALMSEPDTESYSASKGGLLALTHALAISLAPDVRVNAISPGWIETKSYRDLRPNDHAQHPAGRVGRPEDVAEMVAYLLDGERSGFVTGANLIIDGGMTRKMIYAD